MSMLSGNGIPWVMIADSSATTGTFSIKAVRTSGEIVKKSSDFSPGAVAAPNERVEEVDRKRGDEDEIENKEVVNACGAAADDDDNDECSLLFRMFIFPWNLPCSLPPRIRANLNERWDVDGDDSDDLVWIGNAPVF